MWVLAALLFVAGTAGAGYSTWAMFHRPRPMDVLFALVAPISVLVALIGALLLFVPGFFS